MTHRSAVRRVGTAAAVVCLAWASPSTAVADSPLDGNGFAVGGPKINLSTAQGQPTAVQPGLYQSEIPLDTTSRYVQITRQAGERLEFSIVGSAPWKGNKWNADSGSYQGISLSVKDDAGDYCGSASGSSSGTAPGMVSASVAIDASQTQRASSVVDNGCYQAKTFVIEIQRNYDGNDALPMPVQVSLVRTPKVESPDKVASGNDLSEMPYTALEATSSVKPGDGFTDATTVTAGGYNLTAPAGRRMFFKVHLGWNQRLSVGWEAPKNGSDFYASQDYSGNASLYTPSLMPVKNYGLGSISIQSGKASPYSNSAVGVYTAPVRYANADAKDSDAKIDPQSTTSPGWYYIVLDLGPGYNQELTAKQDVPTALSIRVVGTADVGPTMDVKEPDPGAISTQASTALSPAIWGSVLAAGLLATAAVAALLFRRSHRKNP